MQLYYITAFVKSATELIWNAKLCHYYWLLQVALEKSSNGIMASWKSKIQVKKGKENEKNKKYL